jgi:hypothetical protein
MALTKKEKEVIANLIKVARHTRNFPHPALTLETLRYEAVEADSEAERILGKKVYSEICKIAFKTD